MERWREEEGEREVEGGERGREVVKLSSVCVCR